MLEIEFDVMIKVSKLGRILSESFEGVTRSLTEGALPEPP